MFIFLDSKFGSVPPSNFVLRLINNFLCTAKVSKYACAQISSQKNVGKNGFIIGFVIRVCIAKFSVVELKLHVWCSKIESFNTEPYMYIVFWKFYDPVMSCVNLDVEE